MSNGSQTVSLSFKELFSENVIYHIPIYQRAYAWGEDEIVTLLNDIRDAWQMDAHGHYYLGSLVTYRAGASHAGEYEVVDGQQRLTTLFILMCVLRSRVSKQQPDSLHIRIIGNDSSAETLESLLELVGTPGHFRLVFDNREKSNNLLGEMSSANAGQPWEPHGVHGTIVDAHAIITEYLRSGNWEAHADFWTYLFTRVLLIRDELPEETDLNHYFEIMNTRGRQLQTHEIVKARLMSVLDDEHDRMVFSGIWDACASMDRYIQANFEPGLRGELFGDDWCALPPMKWNELKSAFMKKNGKTDAKNSDADAVSSAMTIDGILDSIGVGKLIDDKWNDARTIVEDVEDSSYGSIIDFPNFLLHVLNIIDVRNRGDGNDALSTPYDIRVSLDDKMLLREFTRVHEDYGQSHDDGRSAFAKEFACTLLRCRFLFDNYIIKTDRTDDRSGDDSNWVLQRYTKSDSESPSPTFRSSFESIDGRETSDDGERESGSNQGILMLQAMYQVTETGRTHKNFLQMMLRELFDETYGLSEHDKWLEGESPSLPDADTFRHKMQEYAEQQLHDIIGCRTGDWQNRDEGSNEWSNRGVGTSHFLLNFLDYVLWFCLTNGSSSDELFSDKAAAGSVKEHFESLQKACADKGGKFHLDASAFRFRYRTSVEHFYPRHPVKSPEWRDGATDVVNANYLDSIGNLCLMSRSENSLRSNLPPMSKVEAFGAATQSLKFQFMAGELVKANRWTDDEVREHVVKVVNKILRAVRTPSGAVR